MAEPITIGGQTFIKTNDGWVDQKSKIRAPEGLLSLLNRLQVENSSEGKKKRVRIDTSRPVVKLGKTEYVWDLNSGVWIDKKTKDAANPAFSKLIEAAYQSIRGGATSNEQSYDKNKAADSVVNNMGSTGQAAKQKVTTRAGSGQLPAPNIKINSPIVQMIEKLAMVDGYLKQRLDNQKKIAANNNVMAREASIEARGQLDAAPVIDEEKIKQEAEKENEKSNGAILAVAAIAAASLVSQLEPVKEAFSSVADFAKSIYGYFKDFTNVTNTALESINSMFGDSPTKEKANKSSTGSTATSTAPNPVSSAAAPASTPAASTAIAPNSESNVSAPSSTTSPKSPPKPATPASPPKPATPASPPKTATPASPPKTATPASPPKPATPTSTPKPATPTSTPKPATPAGDATTAKPNASPTTAKPNATPMQLAPAGAGMSYIQTASGLKAKVNSLHAEKFQGFINDLESTGYKINSLGGFANRNVAGTNKKSYHAQGMAIDINPQQNPHTFPGDSDYGRTNMPANVGDLARKHGLGWGGNWRSSKDTMHFSAAAAEQGTASDPRGDVGGGDNIFEKAISTGVDLTKGAMEAIGNILRAGLGPMTATTGSQLISFNDTMSGNIGKAAREKTSAIVDSKTPEDVSTMAKLDPVNMNASSGSSTIQNMPTVSDKAGVEFYLTRMGFPKIIYTQTSRGATVR